MTNIAKLTAELERRIIETALDAILATGCAVSVENEGPVIVLAASRDRAAILNALLSGVAEFLVPITRGRRAGWVRFIRGNGSDVISDFTSHLEITLAAANKLAEDYS